MAAEVYLLHASAPIGNLNNPHGQAQHYLGCARSVVNRVMTQKNGHGASLTRAFVREGVSLTLARVWSGGFPMEQKLKGYKNSPLLCPICNPETAWNRAVPKPKKRRKKSQEPYDADAFEPLLTAEDILKLRERMLCH